MSAHALLPALVLACGLVALSARRVSAGALVLVVMVGAIGVLAPAGRADTRPYPWVVAAALGLSVFVAARLFAPPLPNAWSARAAMAGVIAAVAEEAFFRHALYGWIGPRWGDAAAVVVSAAAFGLVHVPAYGWGVVPMDVAAGLVLGWQRAATGSWTCPAVTHAAANVLMVV